MQTQTICARVSPKLLTKSDRLFTGTIEGRIIEIIQNARRAGATEVKITNKDNVITVKDNGGGITDFQKLLDLGSSGWDEQIQQGEDPAGVGLFCLATSEVTVISGNSQVVIDKDGWTGKEIEVRETNEYTKGTTLIFKDQKQWDLELVEKAAVFTGLKVVVDGKYCHSMDFCSEKASFYKDPGCKIEVLTEISKYHRQHTSHWYFGRILVNFHGQVVQLSDYWPIKGCHNLTVLVDIAENTDIRLMLPARTRLIENDALMLLKSAIELEIFKFFASRKEHSLCYVDYLRAKSLGIELDEAKPQYMIGLLSGDNTEPVGISVPKDFNLADGYVFRQTEFTDQTLEANAHLLAGLGKFADGDKRFIPVTIDDDFIGYSWAELPKITNVQVSTGKEILHYSLSCGNITCFDNLTITVNTSDGRIFTSDVDMAVISNPKKQDQYWAEEIVCVKYDARKNLSSEDIWFHMGGYSDDGDSYDSQLEYFQQELNDFWFELTGPYEGVRNDLISAINKQYSIWDKWDKITVFSDKSIEIVFKSGKREKVIEKV
jgi:hypothetical protein